MAEHPNNLDRHQRRTTSIGSDDDPAMRASQKSQRENAVNSENAHAVTSPVEYAAGSRVPQTGIYIFQHTCSRPAQEVVAVRGWRLPACAECVDGGGYLLQRAVPRLDEDPDFHTEKPAQA
jgi:hypothetical protein